MNETLSVVEEKIKGVLEEVLKEDICKGGLGDAEWTIELKSGLCKLGHDLDCGVCASGCRCADAGEWLFDLVWYKGGKNPDEFLSMHLAVEIEWSTAENDIWDDFEKLLIAKADHRLFVFQQETRREIETTISQMKDRIREFKSSFAGDRYLFAGYCCDHNQKRFIYDLFIV